MDRRNVNKSAGNEVAKEVQSVINSLEQVVLKSSFNSCNVSLERDEEKENFRQVNINSLKDILEDAKENNLLSNYIFQNLDLLMIQYNRGHIIQMNIKEKHLLKKIIDVIHAKNHEQNQNVMQAE